MLVSAQVLVLHSSYSTPTLSEIPRDVCANIAAPKQVLIMSTGGKARSPDHFFPGDVSIHYAQRQACAKRDTEILPEWKFSIRPKAKAPEVGVQAVRSRPCCGGYRFGTRS